jgi:hypothetical protein
MNIVKLKSNEAIAFFAPFMILLFLYLSNKTSRDAFLERDISFASINEYKAIILLSICFLVVVFSIYLSNFLLIIQDKSKKISSSNRHVFVFALIVLLPILIDRYFHTTIFESLHKLFRVSYISPIFADLRTILVGIGCDTVNSVGDPITCDKVSETIWNYPTILLQLRILKLTESSTFWIGLAFIFIYILVILRVSNQNLQNVFLIILLFSPPMLLVINRGNFDLLISSCLIMSGILLNKNKKFSLELSYLLCTIAAILKFYAIVAVIILLLSKVSRKNLIYFALSVSAFILISYSDLLELSKYVGKDMSGSLGLPVLLSHINGDKFAELNILSLGGLVFSIFCLYYYNLIVKTIPTSNIKIYQNYVFILLSFTFTCTWIFTSNYYYRLSLLVLVIPYFFHKLATKMEMLIGICAFVSLYLSQRSLGIFFNILVLPLIIFNLSVLKDFIVARYLVNEKK